MYTEKTVLLNNIVNIMKVFFFIILALLSISCSDYPSNIPQHKIVRKSEKVKGRIVLHIEVEELSDQNVLDINDYYYDKYLIGKSDITFFDFDKDSYEKYKAYISDDSERLNDEAIRLIKYSFNYNAFNNNIKRELVRYGNYESFLIKKYN